MTKKPFPFTRVLLHSGGWLVLTWLVACVPYQKFQDMRTRAERCEQDLGKAEQRITTLEHHVDSLQKRIKALEKQVSLLQSDTARLGMIYREQVAAYEELRRYQEEIKKQLRELLEMGGQEREKLMLDLAQQQAELAKLRQELNQREARLQAMERELQEREKRIQELEQILAQKDSAVRNLQRRVQEALLGFGDDLKVELRNGKVYVSMSEKLMFKSGSIEVEPEGRRALKQLADVLKKHPDITVMVEGHTDNVPIRTSCMKDNWDLSVLRATSVVRLLTEQYGLPPTQVIAAGRGEYAPVATNDTPEGRALNRRIEIILIPPLDELLQILEVQ